LSDADLYFVIADEKFLCASDGSLIVASESALAELSIEVSLSVPVRYKILTEDSQRYWVICVAEKAIVGCQWLGLRTQLGQIPEAQFQLAGRALQIVRWHFDHQFCGRCGRLTEQHKDDLAKTCHHCTLDFYPRLSPCIITLIVRDDYCLLAKHARSKQDRYSCLAGFIEVGESPEQTLEREVKEEVNIEVNNIRYFASQPWPFPGQLMLGYFADYAAGEILVDEQEIMAASWYRYDELPHVPPIATISRQLIDAFVQERKLLHANNNIHPNNDTYFNNDIHFNNE
jgi:NAD+ diphosphatase